MDINPECLGQRMPREAFHRLSTVKIQDRSGCNNGQVAYNRYVLNHTAQDKRS